MLTTFNNTVHISLGEIKISNDPNVILVCYGLEQLSVLFSMGRFGNFILSLSIIEHYRSMSRGVLDTRDIVYFIALIAVFLLLTRTRLEAMKY